MMIGLINIVKRNLGKIFKQIVFSTITSQILIKRIFTLSNKILDNFYLIKGKIIKKRIFAIGLSRTGTRSLTQALKELGYRAYHYPPLPELLKYVDRYEALTDITISLVYKFLDKRYPNSKFILTIRDMESWLESCKNHIKNVRNYYKWKGYVRKKIYHTIGYSRDMYIKAYQKHINDVKTYFHNRTDDLLILNITKGEGYEKLCPFLGKKIISKPFPHLNIGLNKLKNI